MKKVLACLLVGFIGTSAALAEWDRADIEVSVVNINTGTVSTVVKGEIGTIITTVPTGATGTITLATADGVTLFSKSGLTAGTSAWTVLTPAYTAAGVAITERAGGDTNVYTNSIYKAFSTASEVTMTVITTGASSGTNTYKAGIVFNNGK